MAASYSKVDLRRNKLSASTETFARRLRGWPSSAARRFPPLNFVPSIDAWISRLRPQSLRSREYAIRTWQSCVQRRQLGSRPRSQPDQTACLVLRLLYLFDG